MKVKQEFGPVTVTFDDEAEFVLFWDIVEELYQNYSVAGSETESKKRMLLVKLSNMFSDRSYASLD